MLNLDIGKYKHSRFWAVREGGPNGKLVCLCVYRKGAREVVRRLVRLGGTETMTTSESPCRENGIRKGAVR